MPFCVLYFAATAALMLHSSVSALSSATDDVTVTYDPSLGALMGSLYFGDDAATAPLDLITTNLPSTTPAANVTAAAGINFHVSPFITPAQLTSDTFRVMPLAVASLCIGNTLTTSNAFSSAFTVTQIGLMLTSANSSNQGFSFGGNGGGGGGGGQNGGLPTGPRKWFIAPPATSPSSALLLRTLVLNAVSGFTNATAWPSTVLKNPSVVLLANDAAISAALYNCSLAVGSTVACLGPQFSIAPWSAPVQCLRVRRTVNITGDSTSYSNRLTAAAAPYVIVTPADGTVYGQGDVYPFLGGIMVSIRNTLPCDVAHTVTQMLINLFANSTNAASLASLGLQPISSSRKYEAINRLTASLKTDCTSSDAFVTTRISGDGSLYDAMAALAFNRYSYDGTLIGFDRGTTADVTATLFPPLMTAQSALVEAPPNRTLRAARPSVVTAPVFAHGLAIVYTLDGREGLTVSLCTLLGILNGTITFWDDPAIKADNIGVQMPRLKITRIINYDASQEAAGRGVSYIARRCGVGASRSAFNGGGSSFVGNRYPFKSDVGNVASYEVVSRVQVVQGAIGLAPLSSAVAANMQQLSIQFASSQLQLSGTQDDISAALAVSTFNATTSTFRFPTRNVDYFPFVAIVYAVFETNAEGDCDAFRSRLEWLRYLTSSEASALLVAYQQVLLSDAMLTEAQRLVLSARCDGIAVFPEITADTLWWPYVLIACGCTLFASVIAARVAYRSWLLGVRPTDPTKAVAVMFVGIKNQAAVLEAGEENTGAWRRQCGAWRASTGATRRGASTP